MIWMTWVALALAGPTAEQVQGMTGTYRVSDSSSELDVRLAQSVDTTVESMSWALRAFARPQLTRTVNYCSSYDFTVTEQNVSMRCSGASDMPVDRAWSDRQKKMIGADGKEYDVLIELQGRTIKMVFTEGSTVATYRYTFEGDRLKVQKRIQHKYLKEPLQWTVHYARK